ncbi:MAG: DUF4175 domain-containing protein [Paracoccaceae bacterium]
MGPEIWRQIAWPWRLTLAGLWAERLAQALWPLWTLALAAVVAFAFRAQDVLGPGQTRAAAGALGLAALFGIIRAARVFRRPEPAEALARMDGRLGGAPLASLGDAQALGVKDAESRAIWAAHQARLAARAAQARAVSPVLRLSSADPLALRLVAMTALVMALLFAPPPGPGGPGLAGPAGEAALAGGPSWEGWAEPPAHTGLPRLYLPDQPAGLLALPRGTRLVIRLYGAPGDLSLRETVAGPAGVARKDAGDLGLEIARSGELEIAGPGGRRWQLTALPDAPPQVALQGGTGRLADGSFTQGFSASDDYGVARGQVTIRLDLARVDRRFGLTLPPEPAEPVVLDLPMPIRGGRRDFAEVLKDNLSESILANLPVTMVFSLTDGGGQRSAPLTVSQVLPGRRFFDPLAAAVAEMRRDLLWTRANAPRVVQVLRALTHRPEDLIRNQRAFLRLRALIRELDATGAELLPAARDPMVAELWAIALLIEEGDLASARERFERAQDRLDEAIRRGAAPEEIQELMDEMRQALDNYLGALARTQDQREQEGQGGAGPQLSMSADQLRQMFDRLQELMNEGRTAEAAELMEELRRFMENMRLAEGQGGQGSLGAQAMRELQETLRDQRALSDDSFSALQDGQAQGEGEAGPGLPERQRALAERLEELERGGSLPGPGSEAGEAGRRALDRAGRAMRQAEEALRQGDLPGAMDRQAEAMEGLREGMRDLGEALAESQRGDVPGQSQRTEGLPEGRGVDPLGRAPGDAARIGSDENMLDGGQGQRRAQDLLDEIRRRAGEPQRPEAERGYLGRLLELFGG